MCKPMKMVTYLECKNTYFYNFVRFCLDIIAEKPKYEVGSAAKLSFAKKPSSTKVATVWKLTDDDDDDLINENDLLDEQDKVKPNPSDLKGKYDGVCTI